MFTEIVLYTFIVAAVIQLIFWGVIFARLAFYKKAEQQVDPEHWVSVIICAKNEEENLKNFLPKILEQDYEKYEVIVVDDASTDGTSKVLKELSKIHDKLKIVTIHPKESTSRGKKQALEEGIRSSQYDVLLLTDADCYPTSRKWLQNMQSLVKGEVEIVLGYGPYEKKNNFLNKIIQYETTHVALQYMSLSLWGMTYMGVGRNLLYKKGLYFKNQGFAKHKHIASGDDDLFINEVATRKNTAICLDKSSFMYSKPKTNYKNYNVQKNRHYSTATSYKPITILVLFLYSLSHFAFILNLLLGVIFNIYSPTGIILFIARSIVMFTTYGIVLNRLSNARLIKWIPLLDLLYVVYYLFFTPAVMRNKSRQWK